MKPPEDVKKRIVNDWLDKANADIDLAEHLLSDEAAFLSVLSLLPMSNGNAIARNK